MAIFRIIQVCSTWHRIAVAIPDLWKTVKVNCQITSSKKNVIHGVASWISRAANRPISLSLNFLAGEFRRIYMTSSIKWAALTIFELNDCGFDPREAINFLAQCPNIVNIRLVRIDGVSVGGNLDSGPNLTHPTLKSFVVEFCSQTHLETKLRRQSTIHSLFQRLILPNLKNLEIRASHSAVDHELLPSLLQLHVRSRFPLARLHLADILFNVEDLQQFLARLPTLVELHLEAKMMYHSFTDLLPDLIHTAPTEQGNILPKLETIFVADNVFPDDWEAADEAALEMLESRLRKGSKDWDGTLPALKKATIAWRKLGKPLPYRNEAGSRWVKRLLDEGLMLEYPTLIQ